MEQLAQALAQRRVVGDALGDDVARAGKGLFGRGDTLFLVYILCRLPERLGTVALLGKEQLCERLEPLFLRDRRAGAALGLVGAVEILKLGERRGVFDGGGELLRQLALLADRGEDGLAPLLQAAQVLQSGLERAQDRIVHRAVHFLAVARDEGDRVALVEQAHDVFDIFFLLSQLAGEKRGDLIHGLSPCALIYQCSIAQPPSFFHSQKRPGSGKALARTTPLAV